MSVNSPPSERAATSEAIWLEFHDALLGFISRRVPTLEVAEDILQEVMLRIHRSAPEIERVDAVGAWVHAIARNAITDYYRSASTRRELAAGSDVGDDIADEAVTESPEARAELAACVAPLLRHLSPSFREALTLTELQGLTQEDAADRVGISLSGMKSRVQRGRSQLKQVLVQCCEIERDIRGGVSAYQPRAPACDCA
jgi:RNA polymerase sigma-70 factor (ECF subfamily)